MGTLGDYRRDFADSHLVVRAHHFRGVLHRSERRARSSQVLLGRCRDTFQRQQETIQPTTISRTTRQRPFMEQEHAPLHRKRMVDVRGSESGLPALTRSTRAERFEEQNCLPTQIQSVRLGRTSFSRPVKCMTGLDSLQWRGIALSESMTPNRNSHSAQQSHLLGPAERRQT
jgi:hypothetical protein